MLKLQKFFLISLFFLMLSATSAEAITCSNNGNNQQCMVCNCLYESDGEVFEGQVQVAQVVLQRKITPRWNPGGKGECSIIYQKNQFSWTTGPKKKFKPASIAICGKAVAEAYKRGPNGIESFHNTSIRPGWKLARCMQTGNHIFYAKSRSQCPNSKPAAKAKPTGTTTKKASSK
jgi:spore germination cell wall hydrolase CwlJ-like protein